MLTPQRSISKLRTGSTPGNVRVQRSRYLAIRSRRWSTIVTQDSDFADMAAAFGPPPKVLWLRCGNQPTEYIEKLLRQHFEVIEAFESEEASCLEVY